MDELGIFLQASVQVLELDFSFSIAEQACTQIPLAALRLAKTMETLEETQRQLRQRSIQVQRVGSEFSTGMFFFWGWYADGWEFYRTFDAFVFFLILHHSTCLHNLGELQILMVPKKGHLFTLPGATRTGIGRPVCDFDCRSFQPFSSVKNCHKYYPPKTNMSPKKGPFQKESSFPIAIFQRTR